jgi:hypothetical protein
MQSRAFVAAQSLHAVGDAVAPEAVKALESPCSSTEFFRLDAADMLDGGNVYHISKKRRSSTKVELTECGDYRNTILLTRDFIHDIVDTPEYAILRLKSQIAGTNVIFALEGLAPHYGSNYRTPDHPSRTEDVAGAARSFGNIGASSKFRSKPAACSGWQRRYQWKMVQRRFIQSGRIS